MTPQIANYTWMCKREGEEWTSALVPSFSASGSGYKDKTDQGGCFGDGPGILKMTGGIFTLNASLFFEIPSKYSVQVEVKYSLRFWKFIKYIAVYIFGLTCYLFVSYLLTRNKVNKTEI